MLHLLAWSLIFFCGGGAVVDTETDLSSEKGDPENALVARDTSRGLQYDLGVATGYSRIGGGGSATRYATLRLLPEIYYGQLGIGLLANVRVNPRSGGIRDEDFDEVRDYLALIYFVEYGTEEESDRHGRFGSIEETSLSYGLFVDRYSNTHRLDDPMRGFTGSYATGHIQVEGMYADFASPSVFGFHTAYLPFGSDSSSPLPRVSVGVGLAGDFDEEGAVINPVNPGDPFLIGPSASGGETGEVPVGVDDGNLFMAGVDAGVRWLDTETISMLSFVEASKIFGYGVGASLGVQGAGQTGDLQLQVRYEQRILGREFLPDYFGSSYEAERLRDVSLPNGDDESVSAVNSKRNQLAGRQSSGAGFQIQVQADYGDVFDSTVGYETIWGEDDTGRFTLDLELNTEALPVSIRLGYDHFDMASPSDALRFFDEAVLYRLGLAYEFVEPLRLGVEARQTYETVYQNGQAVGRSKQTRIEPLVHFVLRL